MKKLIPIINLLLIGAVAFMALLLTATYVHKERRHNYWIFGMDTSPAKADYQESAVFANGQVLQTPPEGSLARGAKRYPYGRGMEESDKAGLALKNPFKSDEATLARGKVIFERTCMACHGAEARGDGTVTTRGYPPPPSLLADRARGLADGYIFNYITMGGSLMPPYGAHLAEQDRWKAIVYIRDMQKRLKDHVPVEAPAAAVAPAAETKAEPANATAASAPAPKGDWVKADALMKGSDCFACHAKERKVVGPSYKDVAKKYKGKNAHAALVKKVKDGGSGAWGAVPMSPHPQLSDEDIAEMIAGILSLAEGK